MKDAGHYLATGESDDVGLGLASNIVESMKRYDRYLREALLTEVRRRERNHKHIQQVPNPERASLTGLALKSMIDGLFPAPERETVLNVATRSVVFLTRDATHRAIQDVPFRRTAWTIANIYLESLGVPSFAPAGEVPVALNEGTTSYVSPRYFQDEAPFADYVVHEVAHLFHNCKRKSIGLPHSPRREWLLGIAFAKRETFAYACEVYGCISTRAKTRKERLVQLSQYAQSMATDDRTVDRTELLDILAEATEARNGWKRIFGRCSEVKPYRRKDGVLLAPRS